MSSSSPVKSNNASASPVKLKNAPAYYNHVYHKNGELYLRTGPRKQLYPIGLVVPATYRKMNKNNVNKYNPNNVVSNNIGYKKNGKMYIKVKKYSNLIWLPVDPVSNRYTKYNGKFYKLPK
jgi:hypothetical protein